MSAKRRQKGKATESPGPSQEFTDEIEEDDRQEAEEETTSPTLGDLAKGHSELAGQVSAWCSTTVRDVEVGDALWVMRSVLCECACLGANHLVACAPRSELLRCASHALS